MERVLRFVVSGFVGFLLIGESECAAQVSNGNFAAEFSGWTGQVTDLNLTTTTDIDPPGSFTSNFEISSGSAVLNTTTLNNNIWQVFLFQEFMVPNISMGQQLTLSYDLSFALSDEAFGDAVFAQLNHGTSFMETIDLLGQSEVDITALAGGTAQLLFGIEDLDDSPDSLILDNVIITVIPEPSAGMLSLIGLGLWGVVGVLNKRRR